MTIKSESFFNRISSKDKSLDDRERRVKIREDRLFNIQQELMSVGQIDPQPFFEQGRQQGIQEGLQLGLEQAAAAAEQQDDKKRVFGGSMKKGETYLVGERGMELVTAAENSEVIPNEQLNVISSPLNTNRVIIQPINTVKTQTVQIGVPTPIPTPIPIGGAILVERKSSIVSKL